MPGVVAYVRKGRGGDHTLPHIKRTSTGEENDLRDHLVKTCHLYSKDCSDSDYYNEKSSITGLLIDRSLGITILLYPQEIPYRPDHCLEPGRGNVISNLVSLRCKPELLLYNSLSLFP